MSDRELDARLAEQLFPPKERPEWWETPYTALSLPALDPARPVWAGPDLSGSWEGAGLLLEAMVAKGWEPYVGYLDGKWYAGTQLPHQGRDPVADTGPMAVALVAEAARKSEGNAHG